METRRLVEEWHNHVGKVRLLLELMVVGRVNLLEFVRQTSRRMQFHVILECVASIEPFGTKMTGERHFPTVDKSVFFQMMFHTKSLRALAASKRS